MKLEEKRKEAEWYDNASIISWMVIALLFIIIFLSQSFAIKNTGDAANLLSSVLNHNSLFLLMLVYFLALLTNFGKKYFNFINLGLIILYLFVDVTSFLTLIQSFGLVSLINFAINVMVLLYLIHTFLRDTRFWKEFKLTKSPFNEISNDGYFYTIFVLAIIVFAVNLITVSQFEAVILSFLECCYIVLFARFIYLYYVYLDSKKVDINNIGNFDDYKEIINNTVVDIMDKIQLDEKIEVAKDKTIDVVKDATDKVSDFIEENKIDDKIDMVKDKTVEAIKDASKKVSAAKKTTTKKAATKKTTVKKATTKKTATSKGDK